MASPAARPGRGLGSLGERAGHGQDRPFLRLAHRAVRSVARAAKRLGEGGAVELPDALERLGGSPHDLGEDHAGVPSRAHERRPDRDSSGLVARHVA